MPLVSVIIPTLNRPDFLRAALQSVLAQTVGDLEVLVVDDGSAIDPRPVLAALDDGRIRYFRHDANRGEAAARNTGIRNARGAYVAFLDDDDEWLPDKLHLQLDLFGRSPDAVACVYGGHVALRGRDGRELAREIPTRRGDLSGELRERNVIGPPSTVMVTRRCLERVGLFDESIAYGVDYDMWIRIARDHHFEVVSEVIVRYTVHPGQISHDPFLIARGRADIKRKHAPWLRRGRGREARFYFSLGYQMSLLGHMGEARRAFLKALFFNPLQVRAGLYLVASLTGSRNLARLRRLVRMILKGDPVEP
jgi:glycosyltransferase involved in cell wall biosynthesis